MCTMLITLASNVNEKIIKPFTAQMSKVCVLFDFWVIVHCNYSTLVARMGHYFRVYYFLVLHFCSRL